MAVPGVMPRAIAPRPPEDTSFVTTVDPETDRLALGIAARIKALTQGDVYLVVARFDRKYIDANRAPGIAFDQAAAQPYYDAYHAAIRRFVDEIRARHPHGLLIDVHGQAKIPDGLARGTIDGRSIRQLLARAGAAAMTGPNGLFGQLERKRLSRRARQRRSPRRTHRGPPLQRRLHGRPLRQPWRPGHRRGAVRVRRRLPQEGGDGSHHRGRSPGDRRLSRNLSDVARRPGSTIRLSSAHTRP
jgi:hypothetical protein